MKNILFLYILLALLVVGLSPAVSADDKEPLILVMGIPVSGRPGLCDGDIAEEVLLQLRRAGGFGVMVFDPNEPETARALSEAKIGSDIIKSPYERKTAIRIAKALEATHTIIVRGSVQPDTEAQAEIPSSSADKIVITLNLVSVSGKEWTASSESKISQDKRSRRGLKRKMAASSAASGAVSGLIIKVFGQDSFVSSLGTSGLENSRKDKDSSSKRDTEAEYQFYMSQTEMYLEKQDPRNAAMELRKAINISPDEPKPRVMLADIYLNLGMPQEAIDECNRLLLFKPKDISAYNMLARLYQSMRMFSKAEEICSEIIRIDPENVDARMNLGDIQWNLGKAEDAEKSYTEAASLTPEDTLAHERLYKLYFARRLYSKALNEKALIKSISVGTASEADYGYAVKTEVMVDEFGAILERLNTDAESFARRQIPREDYYKECKDIESRIAALEKFLAAVSVPEAHKQAHLHALLAVNLLAQANGYMISYLETESVHYVDQAGILRSEAKTELALFSTGLLKNT